MARKHKIFLIHGMGVYRKKVEAGADETTANWEDNNAWFEAAEKTVKDTYNQYPTLKRRDFDNHYTFVRINYDEYFNAVLQQTETTIAQLAVAMPGDISNALTELAGLGDVDDNFFWTHFVDVFLYKYSGIIRNGVRSRVIAKMLHAINHGADNKPYQYRSADWSVIAHSLGTIVAHDAICDLQRVSVADGYDHTLRETQCVAMVANVIPPMVQHGPEGFGAYDGRICPRGPDSLVKNYVSAGHKLDPFTQAAPFKSAPFQAQMNNDNQRAFVNHPSLTHFRPDILLGDDGEIDDFARLVPHSFAHYFVNPRVHLPIFSSLSAGFDPDGEDREAIIAAFDQKTNTEQRNRAIAELGDFIGLDINPSDGERINEFWRMAYGVLEGLFT